MPCRSSAGGLFQSSLFDHCELLVRCLRVLFAVSRTASTTDYSDAGKSVFVKLITPCSVQGSHWQKRWWLNEDVLNRLQKTIACFVHTVGSWRESDHERFFISHTYTVMIFHPQHAHSVSVLLSVASIEDIVSPNCRIVFRIQEFSYWCFFGWSRSFLPSWSQFF